MMRVQMLASSPRPLADVLVDALRASSNPLRRARTPSSDDIGDQHQYPLRLEDTEEGSDSNSTRIVRPDEVAVAILLGQALDCHRDVLAKLRERDCIAIIEIAGDEYADFVERIFRRHVIGMCHCLNWLAWAFSHPLVALLHGFKCRPSKSKAPIWRRDTSLRGALALRPANPLVFGSGQVDFEAAHRAKTGIEHTKR